jgi:isopentenyl phosphate kinase
LDELVFLKLGGSLITDKSRRDTPRLDIIDRLGQEIAGALKSRPELGLLLGHGSGSFGHYAAQEYGVHRGNIGDWRGYAATGASAGRLNRLVTDALLDRGVPVVSLQPSASARCRGGELLEMAVNPAEMLLGHGLVPLVYGDVALDVEQGCAIISTEQVFAYLADRLRPQRMIIAGEVHGVFTADPREVPSARPLAEISTASLASVRPVLAASHGVDVTGGMLGKVEALLALAERQRQLRIRLVSGMREGMVEAALKGRAEGEGTLLHY